MRQVIPNAFDKTNGKSLNRDKPDGDLFSRMEDLKAGLHLT